MNQSLTPTQAGDIIEAVIARGDIAALTPEQRAKYYVRVCESVGLNPMTKPFEYITLNGKLTLYARKDATDQLRAMHDVSVTDLIESERDGVFIVTAKVVNGKGRADAAKGAVSIQGLKGNDLANAMMKAETKAKRRATLSVCGLGFLDESEIETIPPEVLGHGHKTLPKKDAREIYTKLSAEVGSNTTRAALKAWMAANADRIKVLPEDWQDILRLKCQEMLLDLANQEQVPAHDADGVIWEEEGERPSTPADQIDPMVADGLPSDLKRTGEHEKFKRALLKDIPKLKSIADCTHWSVAASAMEDFQKLNEADRNQIFVALQTRQHALMGVE